MCIPTMVLCQLFVLAIEAEAHNWAPHGVVADNKWHELCWNDSGAWPSELAGNIYVFPYFYSGTGITLAVYPFCAPLMDVWFNDNLSEADTLGRWDCTVPDLANGICIQGTARLNMTYTQESADAWGHNVQDVRYKTWCHELGHSFGADHETFSAQSCMIQGGQNLFYLYSSDHVMHMTNDIQP